MTVEIISWSISTKVWGRTGIELATPGYAVGHASVARHVTDCATRPGPNFVCLLTNERHKTYRQNFHSVAWIMPQGWDLGALGVPRKSKHFFFKHGHVAYQIDGDNEQNRKQVIFILGSNWWPWGEVKRSNLKFRLPYQFQRFSYQTLCVFSQIKENILNSNFILLLGSCPRGGTWACWGVKL